MPTSISFISSSFFATNIVQVSEKTVKISFSKPMLAANPGGSTDALNPANYGINGPAVNAIYNISIFSATSITIEFVSPLIPGLWTVTVNGITSLDSEVINPSPTILNFIAVDFIGQPTLSGGAINLSAEAILKNHASIYKGKTNFDALWAALATGDNHLSQLATNIFDQLFTATANVDYLKDRASDEGVYLPSGLGLGDETIRKLIIDLKRDKLTLQAFLNVINTFYKDKKTRAFVTSGSFEPFSLQDKSTFKIEIDGQIIDLVFTDSDFINMSQVRAIEICNILNSEFARRSMGAFSTPSLDSNGKTHIDIFSGAVGLQGYVKCIGGTAQPALNFPQKLEIENAVGTNWQITKQIAPDIVRISYSGTGPAPALYLLETDCYVVLTGTSVFSENKGSFPIVKIDAINQFIEIQNIFGKNQTFTQLNDSDILFYRAEVFTINDIPLPAFASQYSNQTDVVMPATIDLDRTFENAGYLGSDPGYQRNIQVTPSLIPDQLKKLENITNEGLIPILNVSRTGNLLTINTGVEHGLSNGDKVLLYPSMLINDYSGSLTQSAIESQILTVNVISPTIITATGADLFPIDFVNQPSWQTFLWKNYKNATGDIVLHLPPNNGDVGDLCLVDDLKVDEKQAFAETFAERIFNKYLSDSGFVNPTVTDNITGLVVGDAYYFLINSSFYKYSFETNTISTLESLIPLDAFPSKLIKLAKQDKLFITSYKWGAVYDISQDKWTKTPDYDSSGGAQVVPLPDGRAYFYDNSGDFPLIFDPATWQTSFGLKDSLMANTLNDVTGGVLGISDNGLVFYGLGYNTNISDYNDICIIYDSVQNCIKRVPTPTSEALRRDATIFWNNAENCFIIIGGTYGGGYVSNILRYYPQTETWGYGFTNLFGLLEKPTANMISEREFAFAGAVGNSVQDTWSFRVGRIDNGILTVSRFISTGVAPLHWVCYKGDIYYLTDRLNKACISKLQLLKNGGKADFRSLYKISDIAGDSYELSPVDSSIKQGGFAPIDGAPIVQLFKDSGMTKLSGSYILDPSASTISRLSFELNQTIETDTSYSKLEFVSLPPTLPNSGYIIFNYGTDQQTEPIKFLEKLSPTELRVDSSYIFKNTINSGSIAIYLSDLIADNNILNKFYLTSPPFVRLFAEAIIEGIKAAGSSVNKTIVYPGDNGMGNSNKPNLIPDAIYVWGA